MWRNTLRFWLLQIAYLLKVLLYRKIAIVKEYKEIMPKL
jgi:hypothetical protein